MTRTTTLASLALTPIALIGLPMLAFHRMGLMSFTCAATAAVPTPVRVERQFLADGYALIEVPRPAPVADASSEDAKFAALLAEAEPRNRKLYVDLDAGESGQFAGVVDDARMKQTCHLATGELYSANGGSIRLALRMHSPGSDYDRVGTYSIVGGTGRFQNASGGGSVFAATVGEQPAESLVLTLDGTISY